MSHSKATPSEATPSPVKEKEHDIKRKKPDVKPVVTRREEITAASFFGSAPIKRSQVVRKRGREEKEVRPSILRAKQLVNCVAEERMVVLLTSRLQWSRMAVRSSFQNLHHANSVLQ